MPPLLQPCSRQHEQTPKLWFLHLPDRLEHIPIYRHSSTVLTGEQTRIRSSAVCGQPADGRHKTSRVFLTQHHSVMWPLVSVHIIEECVRSGMVICEHRCGSSRAADTGNHRGSGTVGRAPLSTKDSVTSGRFRLSERRSSVIYDEVRLPSNPRHRQPCRVRQSVGQPSPSRTRSAAVQVRESPL